MSRFVVPLIAAAAALSGCASTFSPANEPDEGPSAQSPGDAIAEAAVTGGRTTAAAAVLAGKVAAEGAETAARTVGTFFWDGPDAAALEWNHGARSTRVVAREQARYTRETASEPAMAVSPETEAPAEDAAEPEPSAP